MKRVIPLLLLTCALLSFVSPVHKRDARVRVKNVKIIYTKPTSQGDAPTLYLKFLNAVNSSQSYTFKGNIPLLQLEMEKPDGSIMSIRNLQDNMVCSFALTLPPGVKDLIISQVGVTGTGWTMTINNGPEIPIEQRLENSKL